MLRTDIGEGTRALQCTTDSNTCCRNNIGGEMRAGDFHFPIFDDPVPIMGTATDGYYRDRGSQLIRLHRQSTGTITGQFRCNIPQASGPPDANLYINIGEEEIFQHTFSMCVLDLCSQSIVDILVSISPFGSNIAGDSYSLECTATVTGSTDQPTITLLDPMNNTIASGVVTTGSMSTLTFNPLAASHAGTYTCRATLGGAVQTAEVMVTVESECLISAFFCHLISTFDLTDPKITASVSADVPPMAGMPLTLTCDVGGAEMITPTKTYQWSRNGMVVSDQRQRTLSFTFLAYSDAGQYSCAVDISSSLLSSSISAVSDPFSVILTCKL